MTEYTVKWNIGGEESIEAPSAEEAEAIMREILSADTELPWLACQGADVEVEQAETRDEPKPPTFSCPKSDAQWSGWSGKREGI